MLTNHSLCLNTIAVPVAGVARELQALATVLQMIINRLEGSVARLQENSGNT